MPVSVCLNAEERRAVDELLAQNHTLARAYQIREEMRFVLREPTREYMSIALDRILRRTHSGPAPSCDGCTTRCANTERRSSPLELTTRQPDVECGASSGCCYRARSWPSRDHGGCVLSELDRVAYERRALAGTQPGTVPKPTPTLSSLAIPAQVAPTTGAYPVAA